MDNKKPKYNLWQNSAYMIATAWKSGNKLVLWLCLVLAALFVANNLLGLFIAPQILAAVEASVPLGQLLRIILLFAGALLLVNAAESYVNINTHFGRIVVRTIIIGRINDKIGKTSYPNTEKQDVRKMLEKAERSCSGNDGPVEGIWNIFTDIIKNAAGFIIYLALLAHFTPWVLALVLGTTVTGFFINKHINGWGYRHREEEAKYVQHVSYINRKARDTTLAKDIRLFGMRDWLVDMQESTLRLYQNFVNRGEKVYLWADVVNVILTFVRSGVAYLYLIGMVLAGRLSAAEFLLYFMAIGGFTLWISGILDAFAQLHRQSLELSVIREFLEYPEPFTFETGQALTPDNGKPYKLELRNLSFRHHGAEKDTLQNINLTIESGEKLAIVGLNGAGKTTLVKMLCGLYDPTAGEVLLNGENIKKFNRRDYYRHFSSVFQDFSVITTSIVENISQQVFDHDMARVKEAAARAGLSHKIEALPKGYHTAVGKDVHEDGTNFSGGEMQRLMLARALYKDAPIIVLDEPTAAMDPIAESEMYTQYHELTGGRTSVYISHRLASTRFCDRVIYVEDGVIAEEGTHEALIRQGGRYAELYEIQSHYYKEGAPANV
ncbi:MAG: ABC transporter ATP-binding protein/permease [Defluviitaleaceae bacterium]|nr:ABC transporter ATP-binding protein/permease [Defluviitaleaceae bacterium]